MKILEGIIVSNAYVLALLLLSTYLYQTKKLQRETTRKLVHIGASNWWFIAMWYFDTALTAAIVPVMFVIVNIISLELHLFKSIEREGDTRDLGRLYYAFSLLVLSVWTFGMGYPEIGLVGVMIMGYADGFATLVGIKYGKCILYGKKTLEGTLAGLFFTVMIVVFFNNIYTLGLSGFEMVIIICAAAFLEFIPSRGLDNLTLPIGTTLLIYFLM